MNKLVLLSMLSIIGASTMAAETEVTSTKLSKDKQYILNFGIGSSNAEDYSANADFSFDALFLKKGNTFYGLTLGRSASVLDDSAYEDLNRGYTGSKIDREDVALSSTYLAATAKHYFNPHFTIKTSAGYSIGDNNRESVHTVYSTNTYEADQTGLMLGLDLAYEFDNGISLGGYIKSFESETKFETSTGYKETEDGFNTTGGFEIGYVI